jgi:hypothetical protein
MSKAQKTLIKETCILAITTTFKQFLGLKTGKTRGLTAI